MTEKKPHLSNLSSIAYVELRSNEALVVSAKIGIIKGRGNGKIELPLTLPTGNYRLIAYTKQMLNEDKPSCFDKILPIYNTLSTDRLQQGVFSNEDRLSNTSALPDHIESPELKLKIGVDIDDIPQNHYFSVSLANTYAEALSLSVSIALVDFPTTHDYSIDTFLVRNRFNPKDIRFENKYIPEYEGEIIKGKMNFSEASSPNAKEAFLSVVGTNVDIYSSSIDDKSGEFSFYTHPIYGNREISIDCPSVHEASFELFDPFVQPPIAPIPALYINKEYESFLEQRSVEMQVSHRFGIDALYDRSVVNEDYLLSDLKPVVYALDDYTRFSAMQDYIIEILKGMRFRKIDNRTFLQILLETNQGLAFSEQNSLVTIDGIAVFDHERLFQFDPLTINTISLYKTSFRIGKNIFSGLAKINTYKGNYFGLTLGKNALILDFKGIHYPSKFTGFDWERTKNVPDVRSLLYWEPQMELYSEENIDIMVKSSSVPGKYAIVLEGITSSGKPVYQRSFFNVK
jgi:hypothetical protein